MQFIQTLTIFLNIILACIAGLFLMDALTPLDITAPSLKSFIYWGFLILSPKMLVWNFLANSSRKFKILGTAWAMGLVLLMLYLGPMKIVFATGAWQAYTVLYQHKDQPNRKIERQRQDVGALGYNWRTVEVTYLLPFLVYRKQWDQGTMKEEIWTKVD